MAFQPTDFRDFDPTERPLVDEWVKVRNVRRRGAKPAGLRSVMIGVGALGLVLVSFAVVRVVSSSGSATKPPAVTHPAPPVKTGVVLSLVLQQEDKRPRHPGDLVNGTLTLVGDDESLHHVNLKAALQPVADSDVKIVKSKGPFKADPGYLHQYVREIQLRMPIVKEAAPLIAHIEARNLVPGVRTTRAEPVQVRVAPKPPPELVKPPVTHRGSHGKEPAPPEPVTSMKKPAPKPGLEVDPIDKDH